MEPHIIDRGRGPEIAGSRITVYDVFAEIEAGATPSLLAGWYGLPVEAILGALTYIEEHKEEVRSRYEEIRERHARGNPSDLNPRIEATHAKFEALRADLLRQERNGEGRPGRH
jgi:uncharacterized protein (DUF433 family)